MLDVSGDKVTGTLNRNTKACWHEAGSVSDVEKNQEDWHGSDRRQAGQFVQSGRNTFFPVSVLLTFTTGRRVTFLMSVPVELAGLA